MRAVSAGLLVLTLLLSGCVVPDEGAPETATPAATSDPTPAPTIAPTPTPPRPDLSVRLVDPRPDPLAPQAVKAQIGIAPPLETPRDLTFEWQIDGEGQGRTTTAVTPNLTELIIGIDLDLPPGDHTVGISVAWPDHGPATDQRDYPVRAPVRLVLNASEKYASDQNVFHSDHIVPFLPGEDALIILERAAATYGFTFKTTYREDLESHFVDAINGTAFRWDVEAAAISRNWMILVDDAPSPYAVDDTHPTIDQTLEFRYVRCYSTGNCDDL